MNLIQLLSIGSVEVWEFNSEDHFSFHRLSHLLIKTEMVLLTRRTLKTHMHLLVSVDLVLKELSTV